MEHSDRYRKQTRSQWGSILQVPPREQHHQWEEAARWAIQAMPLHGEDRLATSAVALQFLSLLEALLEAIAAYWNGEFFGSHWVALYAACQLEGTQREGWPTNDGLDLVGALDCATWGRQEGHWSERCSVELGLPAALGRLGSRSGALPVSLTLINGLSFVDISTVYTFDTVLLRFALWTRGEPPAEPDRSE